MARRRFTTTIGMLSIAAAAACGGQPAEEMVPEEGAVPEEPAPAEPAPMPPADTGAPMDTMPPDTADTTGVTGGQ